MVLKYPNTNKEEQNWHNQRQVEISINSTSKMQVNRNNKWVKQMYADIPFFVFKVLKSQVLNFLY